MKKLIIVVWLICIISLFFYSFTQIDLNLVISRYLPVYNLERTFQYIGYFNRPLSTFLYLTILCSMYFLYYLIYRLAAKNLFSIKEFWFLILISLFILLFSYPAFSYDIFNYMFDAKTIIYYHQNPWMLRPLDFPSDPWLSFMHWTHRPSVYPPFWIGLSLPFYFLSFNFFILALINFKLLVIGSYLYSVYLMEKLLKHVNSKQAMPLLVVYAFNPLLLIEFAVSSHNDIVMIALALLSVQLILERKKVTALAVLILSILTKYLTVVLFPLLLLKIRLKDRVNSKLLFQLSCMLMTVVFIFMIVKMEIQPWYFIWLFPFTILSGWKILWPVMVGFSFGLMLRYMPFLYLGNWNYPVPEIKLWVTIVPILISLLISFWTYKTKHYA